MSGPRRPPEQNAVANCNSHLSRAEAPWFHRITRILHVAIEPSPILFAINILRRYVAVP